MDRRERALLGNRLRNYRIHLQMEVTGTGARRMVPTGTEARRTATPALRRLVVMDIGARTTVKLVLHRPVRTDTLARRKAMMDLLDTAVLASRMVSQVVNTLGLLAVCTPVEKEASKPVRPDKLARQGKKERRRRVESKLVGRTSL